MFLKTINANNYEKSIGILERIKLRNYGNVDIRVTNIHLKKLNTLLGRNIFNKNDAFITAETLWEIMQPLGKSKKHNHHGLTVDDVINGFKSIQNPHMIFVLAKIGI